MANVEQNRNAGEKVGDFLKTYGLIGAMIGAIGILASMKFGGTLFTVGAEAAVVGYAGEKLAGSGKRDKR
jgi:flagellar motor component MotA